MADVLLVADTPWVRNQTHSALGGPANTIREVDDPRAVLDEVGEADVAVVDMQVGSMGGMAIIRSLKDGAMAGDCHAVPVLLLLDRSADTFLAKRAGADDWIVKPFSPQTLQAKVETLVAAAE